MLTDVVQPLASRQYGDVLACFLEPCGIETAQDTSTIYENVHWSPLSGILTTTGKELAFS
jgi:hypothetical protein